MCSLPTFAAPYIGLEFGFGLSSNDFRPAFDDGVILDPEFDYGIATATTGFSFTDNWAVEISYSQYKLSEYRQTVHVVDTEGYYDDEEWDSSLNVKQVEFAPVYRYSFDSRWSGSLKAGVTYSQYRGKYTHTETWGPSDGLTLDVLSHQDIEESRIGGVLGGSIEYMMWPQMSLGMSVKYQVDGYSELTQFNLLSRYYF